MRLFHNQTYYGMVKSVTKSLMSIRLFRPHIIVKYSVPPELISYAVLMSLYHGFSGGKHDDVRVN